MRDARRLIKKYNRQLRFLFFGCVSAGIEFLVFLVTSQFLEVYWSALVGFLCGLVVSFLFNKFVVFKSARKGRLEVGREAVSFLAIGLVNSQVSAWTTLWLSNLMPSVLAKIITMAMVAAWNYLIFSRIVFKSGTTTS